MSADFWAGYVSGAAGIIIGNPLDLLKVRSQAGISAGGGIVGHFESIGTLVRGAPAPMLGYGALNALLFVSYNRTLTLVGEDFTKPNSALNVWVAGAMGGLATWVVSAPTELVKCQAQASTSQQSSWSITREILRREGLKGLYRGGLITSLRDSVGYGFYFWSYELSKRWMASNEETPAQATVNILLCGGLAGVVTWASIFPLDVIKTCVQIQAIPSGIDRVSATDRSPLLLNPEGTSAMKHLPRPGAFVVARRIYQSEGAPGFFRGLGVCSARAFIVNAVQWAVYEMIMKRLSPVKT